MNRLRLQIATLSVASALTFGLLFLLQGLPSSVSAVQKVAAAFDASPQLTRHRAQGHDRKFLLSATTASGQASSL